MGSLMGGEQEHYTKNSDLSFLLAPAGSSNLPMRQSPGKTTPGCSGAPHLILHPRDAPGAVQGDFSLTLLYLLHLPPPPTLHTATSQPKSHHVQGPGGWWSTEVIFGLYNLTSSLGWPAPPLPITRKKGCFVPGCITSSGQSFPWQKQARSRGHSGLHLTVGTTLQKNKGQGLLCWLSGRRPGLHCQLFSSILWRYLMTLLETAATRSMLSCEKSFAALSSEPQLELNMNQQQPQLAWAYFNVEMHELGYLMWFH